MQQKLKRPRISKGILVASTNPITLGLIKGDTAITIAHWFRPISYNKVRRTVIN